MKWEVGLGLKIVAGGLVARHWRIESDPAQLLK